MSDPCFIYPQWQHAKRELFEALGDITKKQQDVLNEWFRLHIFEVGVDSVVSKLELESLKTIDITKYIRDRHKAVIADFIFKKGLYLEQDMRTTDRTLIRNTVLVCGAPIIVGDASRTES